MNHLIAPSLLAADFANLQRDIEMVNRSQADWFHLDIMDGVFVPNISFGMPVINAISRHAKKPLDVHLMIVDPDRYLETFHALGAAVITVHVEACTHLHRTVQKIRSLGIRAGVVLNPHTPVAVLEDILEEVDMVLIMSVNPGFGAQSFIENSYAKIRRLKQMIVANHTDVLIEVDGGVDLSNAAKLVEAGVDVLVAGNTVFSSKDPIDTISRLKQLL